MSTTNIESFIEKIAEVTAELNPFDGRLEAAKMGYALANKVNNNQLFTGSDIGTLAMNWLAMRTTPAIPDSEVERLREALEKIVAQEENQGREGCTYGDTDYDSMSVVYGYNTCLMYLKEIANKALSPTKTQQ